MKLTQYIAENTITGFDIIPNQLIVNVNTAAQHTGLGVDTSNIQAGTKLVTTTSFSVAGDILTVGNLTLNIAETDVLGFEDPQPE